MTNSALKVAIRRDDPPIKFLLFDLPKKNLKMSVVLECDTPLVNPTWIRTKYYQKLTTLTFQPTIINIFLSIWELSQSHELPKNTYEREITTGRK